MPREHQCCTLGAEVNTTHTIVIAPAKVTATALKLLAAAVHPREWNSTRAMSTD
jgi:hypothetical protein